MARARIELDGDGVGELLRSADVQRMLDEKAARVAAAAQSLNVLVEDDDVALPIRVEASPSATRAGAVVIVDHPSALSVEAKHRLLASALDAAR